MNVHKLVPSCIGPSLPYQLHYAVSAECVDVPLYVKHSVMILARYPLLHILDTVAVVNQNSATPLATP